MARALTHLVEFLVGLACLIGGVATLRTTRTRCLGVVLLVAGLAAIVHAVVELLP